MHFHVFVKGPGSTFHLSAAKSTIDIHVNTIAKSIASYIGMLVVQSSSVDFYLQKWFVVLLLAGTDAKRTALVVVFFVGPVLSV